MYKWKDTAFNRIKIIVAIIVVWSLFMSWLLWCASSTAVTYAIESEKPSVDVSEGYTREDRFPTQEELDKLNEEIEKETEEFYRNLDLTKLPGVEGPKTVSTITINEDDAVTLAKLVYGEGRGIASKAQKAAIIWCVLNRVEDSRFDNTIYEVVTAKNQFEGYNVNNPVWEELLDLSRDVLERWEREKNGDENVGRTLPKDYLFFYGNGKVNKFTKQWREKTYWDWSLESPYER